MNVLIALIDRSHVHHDLVHRWFEHEGHSHWATCPLTENGLVRILGHSCYPNSAGSPAAALALLQRMRSLPGHVFWSDSISLLDPSLVGPLRLLTSSQVTDSYLLALAVARAGRLATLDRRLIPDAVKEGFRAVRLIH